MRRSLGAWRPHRDRRGRILPGRDLPQGRRDRDRRRCRAHERVHGQGRDHPDRRGRGRFARRLALRGRDLRRREDPVARRRRAGGGARPGRRAAGPAAGARRRFQPHLRRGRDQGRVRQAAVQLRLAEGPEVLMEPELPETPGPLAPGNGRPLPWTGTERSYSFPPEVIGQIHEMAEVGRYEIRGWGAKRRMPTFDDLVVLTASLSRYPLAGYRERCDTTTALGTRRASRPLELAIPITIAGMSFGALSAHAKEALGRAASAVGTSTTTGDGGMTPEERRASRLLVYQCLPSRYGFNLADLKAAETVQVFIVPGGN